MYMNTWKLNYGGKKNKKSGFFCRGLVVTGEGHANTEMFYEIREGDSKRLRDSES